VEQLEQLQHQIEGKLSDRTEGVDIGYWESLLSQLKAHTARGRLRDRHQQLLRSKLAQLKAEQLGKAGSEAGPARYKPAAAATSAPATFVKPVAGPSRGEEEKKKEEKKEEEGEKEKDQEETSDEEEEEEYAEEEEEEWGGEIGACISEYNKEGYSPAYTQLEDLPLGTVTCLEEEDLTRREFDQQKAMKGSQV
jgi:hypothetical protein